MRHLSALDPELNAGSSSHDAAVEHHGRLAADLHDTVLQPLVSLVVSLEAMARRPAGAGELEPRIAVCKSLAHEALSALRAVLTGTQVHPHVHDGLLAAIERYLRPQLERQGILLYVRCQDSWPGLPDEWPSQMYLIVREAATNAAKHASATAVTIELVCAEKALSIIVTDNGTGFTSPAHEGLPPSAYGSGRGLCCMRARAESLGGSLTVVSIPGQGTQVAVHVPHAQAGEQLRRSSHTTSSVCDVIRSPMPPPEY
jgi:signal transduction histidine kinase